MRALQCDFTTVYYFSTRRLCLLSSSAARGRNGRARTRRQLGVSVACEIERKPAKTGNRAFPVCSYAREEGGGNGGHGGGGSTPGTKFDDQSGSPLGDRHSLLGIAITLACGNVRHQDDVVHINSASSKPDTSASERQTALFVDSPLHEASKLEDTLNSAQPVSVCQAFAGRTVLLTGVTGFVGSLVLEQLLRTCPDVHKVFVIARQKHSIPGPDRVHHMLRSHPLFHLVKPRMQSVNGTPVLETGITVLGGALSAGNTRLQSRDFPQVEVLAGDMTLPEYGLGEPEIQRLKQQTEIVIHAAASITFDDHIHNAITHNYMATKHLADLAAEMPKLRAFVHVSTAYVNGNQPKGTTVPEHMLGLGGVAGDHLALVNQLQALPKAQAASQVDKYMQQWRFPNTYCFSKHLAESLMASYHSTAFPVAIVRPSIIGGLAGTPLPGYVGNTAGSTGAALAIATGIAAWTCHQPSSVFDVVPGDLVSSTILAAAAAISQGHKAHSRHPLIVHACTSSQNPLSTGQFFQHIQAYFTSHPPPFKVILGDYPKYQGRNIVHTKQMLAARSALAEAKFLALCTALRIAGRERLAKKLYAGWKAWQKYNSPALDFNLCFCSHNSQRLQQLLPDEERQLFRLSWDGRHWRRYMTTYMAGIRHGVLKQPTQADPDQHDFAPWPVRFSADGRASKALDIKPAHA